MAKLPKGPVPLHKSLAAGQSLKEASAEEKVGGSKKDKSHKTNR